MTDHYFTAPLAEVDPEIAQVLDRELQYFNAPLSEVDPEIAQVLERELERQRGYLEMIASENFVPVSVLQSQGSVLTNKYAEGYPGRRYYGGCEEVDVAEELAIERAKSLFGAEFANVQPHSGATANAAVLHAIARPGDTLLGLSLDQGGHLTHGMKINFSGRLFNIVAYGVDPETSIIDMDEVRRLAIEHQPKVIIAGWSAYPRQLDFARVPRDRRRGRRAAVGRHGALRRARRRRAAPEPRAARARRLVDRAQDDRRTALGLHPHERRRDREEDQLGRVPGPAGRPAHARHRGEGDGVQARGDAGVQGAPGARPAAARTSSPSGCRSRT